MSKEECPHCGWKTSRLDIHEEVCARTPANLDELFMEGDKNITEWGEKFGVSAQFIRQQLERLGLTVEQMSERLDEISENHNGQTYKPITRDKKIVSVPADDQCERCGVVLWNDPAHIPRQWANHFYWHINFGGVCMDCVGGEGNRWIKNRTLMRRLRGRPWEKKEVVLA